MIHIYADIDNAVGGTNMLGQVSEPITAVLEEGLNDEFICNFSLPIGFDTDWAVVTVGNVVKVKDQFFDIVRRTRRRNNDGALVVEAECEHLSYRLLDKDYGVDLWSGRVETDAVVTNTSIVVNELDPGDISVGDVLRIGAGDFEEYKQVISLNTSTNTIGFTPALSNDQPSGTVLDIVSYFEAKTATEMLTALVSGTDLTVGTVEPTGTETFLFREISGREALVLVADRFGGELEYSGTAINLLNYRGSDPGIVLDAGVQISMLEDTVDSRDEDQGGVSGSVDVVELKELAGYGAAYEFEVGDRVTLVDGELSINQALRIVHKTEDIVLPMLSVVDLAQKRKRLEGGFLLERSGRRNDTNTSRQNERTLDDRVGRLNRNLEQLEQEVSEIEGGGEGGTVNLYDQIPEPVGVGEAVGTSSEASPGDHTHRYIGKADLEVVTALPAIPLEGMHEVYWTSAGGGTGDNQIWRAFEGQSLWYPTQKLTILLGTPEEGGT